MQEQARKCSVNQPQLRVTQQPSSLAITTQWVQINTLSDTEIKQKGKKRMVIGKLW